MDTQQRDGRTYAPLDELENWSENPKDIEPEDLDRLQTLLDDLGQFKPLIVTDDGTVIGGNQRLKAMREMGWDDAFVTVIDPTDKDEMMEIALADNDRAGYYEEDRMGDLLDKYDIDVDRFKVDFYAPQDLEQSLSAPADPEDFASNGGGADDVLDDFEPADETGTLDETTSDGGDFTDADAAATTTCPDCGHEFQPE